MEFITTRDGNKLYCSDQGQGSPVVLIHGWPLNADMWEYQTLALLERGHRVIAYDRRGFGRSSKPASGYTYDTFADDLRDVLEQRGVDKAALVGFSMGGGEVARYLSRHGSARVSKCVLISSVTPYMLKTDDNPKGVPEKAFQDMATGLREDRPHFLHHFTKDFYGVGFVSSPVSSETFHWSEMLAYQASLKASVDCVRAFGHTDFRPDMKAFANVPTMIIHGTADKTVPIEPSAEAAARAIAHATFHRYEGAPHGLFITHKNRLIEDLLGFLK